MEFVLISDPNNPIDPATNTGRVDYIFEVGKYLITNSEYAEFLNAVAAYSDPYGLYSINMNNGLFGGIQCTQENGYSSYEAIEGYANLPVVYVSWFDAARFCNWIHFGKPTAEKTGLGITEGDSEVGAYNTSLFGDSRAVQKVVTHNSGAKFWLPTLCEWNKAAYYDPSKDSMGGYWLYATRSDSKPKAVAPPGDRFSANYYDFGWAAPAPYLTAVGSYQQASSYYGTYDQGGNVWEWVETLRPNKRQRWVRGGGATTYDHALSRLNVDCEYGDHELYIFGFRLAKQPEVSL
jgi:formylglycine-generating enzyme